jgi:large subunit ribosomal protein L15
MNELSRLKPPAGQNRKRNRIGRGLGSGNGKTSGKGQKGQKARSGGKVSPGFEGGQMPLHRRLPKYGFTNIFRVEYTVINVDRLNAFPEGAVVDAVALAGVGLAKNGKARIKVLGNGDLQRKLTVRADKFSASARAKIEAVGGAVEVVGG